MLVAAAPPPERAVMPDGRRIASASYDGTLGIWDLVTVHGRSAFCAVTRLHVFRIEDGSRLACWPSWADGHVASGGAPAFSPDSRLLAFPSEGAVRIWDREHDTSRELPCGHTPFAAAFTPDGQTIFAWSPRGAKRFEVASGREVATHAALDSRFTQTLFVDPSGRFLPGMGKSAILTRWLDLTEEAGRAVPHYFVRRGVADWDRPEAILNPISLASAIGTLSLRAWRS